MSNPAIVNVATLNDLGSAIGTDRVERLVERFESTLASAFGGEEQTATEVGREAHTLVSAAGMLGCDAFFQACRTLEYAAKQGADITEPLAEACRLRDVTVDALHALRRPS